jgi:hypothetical protein
MDWVSFMLEHEIRRDFTLTVQVLEMFTGESDDSDDSGSSDNSDAYHATIATIHSSHGNPSPGPTSHATPSVPQPIPFASCVCQLVRAIQLRILNPHFCINPGTKIIFNFRSAPSVLHVSSSRDLHDRKLLRFWYFSYCISNVQQVHGSGRPSPGNHSCEGSLICSYDCTDPSL